VRSPPSTDNPRTGTIVESALDDGVHAQLLLLGYNVHALLNPLVYVLRTSAAFTTVARAMGTRRDATRTTCELVREAPPAYRTYDDLQRAPYDQMQTQARRIVVTADLTVNRHSILMV